MPKGITQTAASAVKHCPILRFYDLGSPATSTRMTVANFQALMTWLKAQGYVPQYLSDYIRWMRGEMDLPRKSCVLVFYGAFVSQYSQAFPYLQGLGFKFNLMIPGSFIQYEASLQTGIYFTLANLQTMVASGLVEPHSNGFHVKWSFLGAPAAISQLYSAAQVNLKWGGLEELVEDAWSYAPLIGTNSTGNAVQSTYVFTCAPRGYRQGAATPTQIVAAYLVVDHLSTLGTAYSPLVNIGVKKHSDASYTTIKTGWQPAWNQASQVVTLDTPFTFVTGVQYDLQFTSQSASGGAAGELVCLGSRTASASPVTLDATTTYKIHPPAPPSLQQTPGGALAQRRYYVRWTQVSPSGETIGSGEATILLSANYLCQLLTQIGTILPGATAFNVYAGTTSGSEVLQTSTPVNFYSGGVLQGWTEPTSGLVSSTGVPPVNAAVLAPPAAPTLSTVAGGSLLARYYNVVLTYTNPAGETMPGPEITTYIGAGYLLQVSSPAGSSNATGWNVYISQGAPAAIGNAASLQETKQNVTPILIGISWTEPQTGLVAGTVMPQTPTALAPVPTTCASNSSASGYTYGEQIGGDIYLLESLSVETVAQLQARVLQDAQANLNFLSLYMRPQEIDIGYAYPYDTYNIGTGALTPPSAPTLSSVPGGNQQATTYYAQITYLNANGETLASAETSLQVSAGYLLSVSSPPTVSGATGWNVYVGLASGAEQKQNGPPNTIGTAWTELATGIRGTGVPPVANGTGVYLPRVLRSIHPLQMTGSPVPGDRWSNLDPRNSLGAPSSYFPLRQITPVLDMTGTTALAVLENQIGAFSGLLWDSPAAAPDPRWSMENILNVKAFFGGLMGTGEVSYGASMASSSSTVVLASATNVNGFAAADVGKSILVSGANTSGDITDLWGTISSVTDATHAVISLAAPSGGLTSCEVYWWNSLQDDGVNLNTALATYPRVYMPAGVYVVSAASVPLLYSQQLQEWWGDGPRQTVILSKSNNLGSRMVYFTDANYLHIHDFATRGPGINGVFGGQWTFNRSAQGNIERVNLERIEVKHSASTDAIYFDTPILCSFRNVKSLYNVGNGLHLYNGVGCVLDTVYAITEVSNGIFLENCVDIEAIGCAAESSGINFYMKGCTNVHLGALDVEAAVHRTPDAPASFPTPSVAAGGTIPVGTYYLKYTWVRQYSGFALGLESLPSPESTLVTLTSGNQKINFTLPAAPTDAPNVNYANIYLTPTNGASGSEGYEAQVAVSGSPTAVSLSSYSSPGAAPPYVSGIGHGIVIDGGEEIVLEAPHSYSVKDLAAFHLWFTGGCVRSRASMFRAVQGGTTPTYDMQIDVGCTYCILELPNVASGRVNNLAGSTSGIKVWAGG